jgi:hypothetical protein
MAKPLHYRDVENERGSLWFLIIYKENSCGGSQISLSGFTSKLVNEFYFWCV